MVLEIRATGRDFVYTWAERNKKEAVLMLNTFRLSEIRIYHTILMRRLIYEKSSRVTSKLKWSILWEVIAIVILEQSGWFTLG